MWQYKVIKDKRQLEAYLPVFELFKDHYSRDIFRINSTIKDMISLFKTLGIRREVNTQVETEVKQIPDFPVNPVIRETLLFVPDFVAEIWCLLATGWSDIGYILCKL